jgi:DNA polymerase-3 subunit delta'
LDWLAAKGVREPEIALAQAGFAPLAAEQMVQTGFWDRRRTLTDELSSIDLDPQRLAAQVDAGELRQFWDLLSRWCYDLMALRLAKQVRYNPDYAEKLRRLADNADVLELGNMVKELTAAGRALDHPLNPRLVVEQLAIRYTRAIGARPS